MKRMIISSTQSNRWRRDKSFSGWRNQKRYDKDYPYGYGHIEQDDETFIVTLYDENDEVVYKHQTPFGVYFYPQHVQGVADKKASELGLI